MIKKSLYILTILSTISISSIAEVDAMSLNDALQSENIVLNFENGGTIWCEYADRKGFAPHPGYINKDEYLYDNNTYYLPLNTLLIQSNTSIGGGVNNYSFLANIGGSNNIFLQEYRSNDKVNDEVIRSIVFAGDNSQYTGTLYLTPSITKIIFEKEESVISNISIPEVIKNNGSDKDKKPFKLPQSPKMVDIYLPENGHFGTLSITGGIVVTLLTNSKNQVYLSFNEVKVPSNTLFVDDRIHIINHHNSNCNYNKYKYKHNKKKYLLRDINIKGISEETMNKKLNKAVSQSNNNYTTVNTTSSSNKQIEELMKQLAEYKLKAEKSQNDLEVANTRIETILKEKGDTLAAKTQAENERAAALNAKTQAESERDTALNAKTLAGNEKKYSISC